MVGTALAFWTTAAGTGELREEPLPPVGEDEVLVRALFSGVSRGTESLVFEGRVPPSEYERMRAPFMGGAFPFPVKYGYASVGRVEEGPAAWRGQHVFCLFPHQSRYVVPTTAVTPLPPGVPPRRAVLSANLETAINAVWDGRIGPGDRIAVVGAGVVGALVAWIASRTAGAEVTLVDVDPRRAELAAALGLRFASPAEADAECDVVFHASGHPDGLRSCLRLAGVESTIVELSWYGDRAVTLPLGEAFHARRLRIVSSQVGTIPADRRSRWTYARRLALATRLLADDELDHLLSSSCSLADLPATMPEITAAGAGTLCHVVHYPPAA